MQYTLTTPCTAQDLAPLRAGDTVLLSGVVYTARDQAHKRMIEALDRGEPLPFDLEGSAIYYVGPTPERPGEVIGSAGPTTSGLKKFDQAVADGKLDYVVGTNLTYRQPELLTRDWYVDVDVSKYAAYFVVALNHDMSVSSIIDPIKKIEALLAKRS